MLRILTVVALIAAPGVYACTDGGLHGGGGGGLAGSGGSAGSADGIGGVGGNDANGGSGGAAGHGPGGFAWYEDPEIWKPIPEGEVVGEACRPLYADPAWAVRKILDWEPCGTGCEKAVIDIGNDVPGLHLPVATTAEADGVGMGFLAGTSRRTGDDERTRLFRHTIRLDDGYLLSMLQHDSAERDITSICGFGRSLRSALAPLVGNSPSGVGGVYRYVNGAIDAMSGETKWFPPWQPDPLCDALPIETNGGLALLGTCHSLSYVTERSDDPIVLKPDAEVLPTSAAQYRGFVVWPEFLPGGNTRIRAWTPEGGMYTLVEQMPGITCQVAVNGESIIGWQVGPADHCDGFSDDIRLWRAPFTREEGALNPVVLPPLSDKVLGGSRFSGWGDHAMLTIIENDTGDVYHLVARFSDGMIRKLRSHPDNNPNGYSVTLSERYAYLGQTPKTRTYGFVDVMYRWDLSQLEEWGEPYPPPEESDAAR